VFFDVGGKQMRISSLLDCLEQNPIIAAVSDDGFDAAISSPAKFIFYLSADLMSVKEKIQNAHDADKYIFIHIDLAVGIGKDRTGIQYLAKCGADGIISTRAQLIRFAKDQNLVTVQRFFALDSKGMESIEEMLRNTNPSFMEIMPGVIGKAISRFSGGNVPVIAGGLIQTKQEVMEALRCGATAVSTGCKVLWDL
jgi:glycerol uptake operon antiterminator